MLGLLEVITIAIPFVFWRYGSKIRSKSKMLNQLQDELDAVERKRARDQERRERRARREAEDAERGDEDYEIDEEVDIETTRSERRESEPDTVEEKGGHSMTVKRDQGR